MLSVCGGSPLLTRVSQMIHTPRQKAKKEGAYKAVSGMSSEKGLKRRKHVCLPLTDYYMGRYDGAEDMYVVYTSIQKSGINLFYSTMANAL